jgi:hypothetical protein
MISLTDLAINGLREYHMYSFMGVILLVIWQLIIVIFYSLKRSISLDKLYQSTSRPLIVCPMYKGYG